MCWQAESNARDPAFAGMKGVVCFSNQFRSGLDQVRRLSRSSSHIFICLTDDADSRHLSFLSTTSCKIRKKNSNPNPIRRDRNSTFHCASYPCKILIRAVLAWCATWKKAQSKINFFPFVSVSMCFSFVRSVAIPFFFPSQHGHAKSSYVPYAGELMIIILLFFN